MAFLNTCPIIKHFFLARVTWLIVAIITALVPALEAQERQRRNFYGMHNLKDGGVSIPEGMNWTRHLVGEGGYVFDWVRGDYGHWVVDAMDRGLIPCLRVQSCAGGCDPDPGYPENVAHIIRQHLEEHRPEYLNRLIYFQVWNEPGDPRDWVTPADYADYQVAAYAGVKRADVNGVIRVMTPGQNGSAWWEEAIRANPGVCQAFDVWATHPYPESYPPHYNHHDGVPFINQVKTIDSYLLDLDVVARVCEELGSARRGFPVMITETAYGNHLGISYEGYPKTTRGDPCFPGGACEYQMAARYNRSAFTEFWHHWPEVLAVHPFILNNWSWDHFAFVSKTSGSRRDGATPSWCPPEEIGAATPWPPNYSEGAQRCGLPDAPFPQYNAILEVPKPPPALLEPYDGPVGVLRGTVRRSDTGEPVRYATLSTDGYEFGGPSLFDGQYVIRDVPIGTYTLAVNKVGYGSTSRIVVVEDGRETFVDFDLVHQGKVSKGIYFQNQGTCSGCNLYAPFLGQTIVTPADVGFIKFAAAMPNVGNVTMKFSVLDGGPTGSQVGESITAYLEWGGEMIGAEWPGDGVAVEPNHVYFIKVERIDGEGVYLYATDSDPYADGMAFTGTTPHPGWDLLATVRGTTLATLSVTGAIEGQVEDAANRALAGTRVIARPGDRLTTTSADGRYTHTGLAEGVYELSASLEGYETEHESGIVVRGGETTTVNFVLTAVDTPDPPANLVENGDFSQGLEGWSLWTERGEVGAVVDSNGWLHLSGVGINGGLYQSFNTGGAGAEITIDGVWASQPTAPNAQWAEVLIINGPRSPVPGQDVNAGQSDVVVVYKNDTWATSGWFGDMAATAVVTSQGRFTAAADTATLVLKTGNLLGVHSGTRFDDIVVGGPGAPPEVNRPPSAVVSAGPTEGAAPLTVAFDASASSDPDGNSLSYSWDFGDGDTDTGPSPSHTYSSPGSYVAQLTVSDGRGASDSSSVQISVDDPSPPVVGVYGITIDPPPAVAPGERWWELVTLRHLSCEENGGKHHLYSAFYYRDGTRVEQGWQNKVRWKKSATIWGDLPLEKNERIGDDWYHGALDLYWNDNASLEHLNLNGNIFKIQRISGVHTRHPDECPGGNTLGHHSFIAIYEERIGPGEGAPGNQPPTAVAHADPLTGEAPLTVSFDGSGSSDPEGSTLSYLWEFGDGESATGSTLSHTYAQPGSYAARLTVDDGSDGTDTDVVSILVAGPGASPSKSKLTIHAGFGGPRSMQFVQRAQPRLIKILDSFSAAADIKRISPDTQIIGRAYQPHQPMDGEPVQRAREWWHRTAPIILQYPEIDYWEGYNEPIIQSVQLMDWFARFEAERVRILAENGRRACIGNFSVGNPDLPLWPAFYPAIDAARAHGGILGLHEYGTPMQQHFDETIGEGWFCGRYRKLYRQYLIPDDKVIPLAITECGVDVVPPVGWRNHYTDEEYLDQLFWYDRVLLQDDFVVGATIFALEIPGWFSFDIAPIVDRLADYVSSPVAAHP